MVKGHTPALAPGDVKSGSGVVRGGHKGAVKLKATGGATAEKDGKRTAKVKGVPVVPSAENDVPVPAPTRRLERHQSVSKDTIDTVPCIGAETKSVISTSPSGRVSDRRGEDSEDRAKVRPSNIQPRTLDVPQGGEAGIVSGADAQQVISNGVEETGSGDRNNSLARGTVGAAVRKEGDAGDDDEESEGGFQALSDDENDRNGGKTGKKKPPRLISSDEDSLYEEDQAQDEASPPPEGSPAGKGACDEDESGKEDGDLMENVGNRRGKKDSDEEPPEKKKKSVLTFGVATAKSDQSVERNGDPDVKNCSPKAPDAGTENETPNKSSANPGCSNSSQGHGEKSQNPDVIEIDMEGSDDGDGKDGSKVAQESPVVVKSTPPVPSKKRLDDSRPEKKRRRLNASPESLPEFAQKFYEGFPVTGIKRQRETDEDDELAARRRDIEGFMGLIDRGKISPEQLKKLQVTAALRSYHDRVDSSQFTVEIYRKIDGLESVVQGLAKAVDKLSSVNVGGGGPGQSASAVRSKKVTRRGVVRDKKTFEFSQNEMRTMMRDHGLMNHEDMRLILSKAIHWWMLHFPPDRAIVGLYRMLTSYFNETVSMKQREFMEIPDATRQPTKEGMHRLYLLFSKMYGRYLLKERSDLVDSFEHKDIFEDMFTSYLDCPKLVGRACLSGVRVWVLNVLRSQNNVSLWPLCGICCTVQRENRPCLLKLLGEKRPTLTRSREDFDASYFKNSWNLLEVEKTVEIMEDGLCVDTKSVREVYCLPIYAIRGVVPYLYKEATAAEITRLTKVVPEGEVPVAALDLIFQGLSDNAASRVARFIFGVVIELRHLVTKSMKNEIKEEYGPQYGIYRYEDKPKPNSVYEKDVFGLFQKSVDEYDRIRRDAINKGMMDHDGDKGLGAKRAVEEDMLD